ncbi:MAG: Plug domain-containing protein, partial [Gammaproteobacteria bacterium]
MKSYSKLLAIVLCLFMTNIASAMLGPIPIYLNSEYRTSQNIVGSTSSAISFTKEEILSSGASNIGELLDSIPGINYESGQGNLTSMRIRGNEASHTLLIVDGSKITIGATQPNLDLIPLEIIDQIDILKVNTLLNKFLNS